MSDRQLTNVEQRDLDSLNWSWAGAYTIAFDGSQFVAVYQGPEHAPLLTDPTIYGIRQKIRHDYPLREGGLPRGD